MSDRSPRRRSSPASHDERSAPAYRDGASPAGPEPPDDRPRRWSWDGTPDGEAAASPPRWDEVEPLPARTPDATDADWLLPEAEALPDVLVPSQRPSPWTAPLVASDSAAETERVRPPAWRPGAPQPSEDAPTPPPPKPPTPSAAWVSGPHAAPPATAPALSREPAAAAPEDARPDTPQAAPPDAPERARPDAPAGETAAPTAADDDSLPRVLLAETDPTSARVLRHRLERDGLAVTLADDAASALGAIGEGGIDLLLIDADLPGGAFEVLRRVRRGHGDAELPAIVLAWPGNDLASVRAFGVGTDDVVTRPYSLAEVTARVRYQLRRRQDDRLADRIAESVEARMRERLEQHLADHLADALAERVETGILERLESHLAGRLSDRITDRLAERVAREDREQDALADRVEAALAARLEGDLADRIADRLTR